MLHRRRLLRVTPVYENTLDRVLALAAVWLPLVHQPDGRVAAFAQLLPDGEYALAAAHLARLFEDKDARTHSAPREARAASDDHALLERFR